MAKTFITNRYGVIPNLLLNNDNITLKAKGLYAYIQSKPDSWDFSLEKIASQCKEGVDSIRNAVRELEEAGYLIRKNYQNELGQWDCDYYLYDRPRKPEPLIKETESKDQSTQKEPYRCLPNTDYPNTENTHTIVNKISKKDINNIYTPDFEEFYSLYPKKTGKKNAFNEWKKTSSKDKEEISKDLILRKQDKKWIEGYVKDPERYLKYRQWEDEIIKPKQIINNNALKAPVGKYDKFK